MTPHRPPPTTRLSGDSGRITILAISLVVLLVAIIGVTSSATYVTTQRRHLLALADAASHAAAQQFSVHRGTGASGDGELGADRATDISLDPDGVRALAADYLRETSQDAAGLQQVRVVSASVEPDGSSLTLTLAATVSHPWAAGIIGQDSEVAATSRARIALGR